MIATIEGKLLKLDTDSALVQVGAIGYEVMLPGYCIDALSGKVGSDISLYTMEYYEGTPGGGNMIPRIVGFLNAGRLLTQGTPEEILAETGATNLDDAFIVLQERGDAGGGRRS